MATSMEALFDIKFIDIDAPSHRNRLPESVLESGAIKRIEKRIYRQHSVSEPRVNLYTDVS